MSFCCYVQRIPALARLLLGMLAIFIGIPLFLLPIPFGVVVMAFGLVLVTSAVPSWRKRLMQMKPRFPRFYKILRPFLENCDECQSERPQPPANTRQS